MANREFTVTQSDILRTFTINTGIGPAGPSGDDGADGSDASVTTANVTAAGALMDSEVVNLADVKAFDTTNYATAAQGATADSAQQPATTLGGYGITDAPKTDPTGVTGADAIDNMMSLTQAEYDAIGTPDASTLYIISP